MPNDETLQIYRLNYENLRSKYFQQRKLADLLLEPLLGTSEWRLRLTLPETQGTYRLAAPVRFTVTLPGLDPKLFDYMWNHIDQTHYLHWSVYHIYWDWLVPPDANGHGGLNVGIQQVPAHGGELDAVFATWDNPLQFLDFPITSMGSILIRFWRMDPQKGCLVPLSLGPASAFLSTWDPAPEGGVVMRTVLFSHTPEQTITPEMLQDTDMSVALPHEMEEASSWVMANTELARRRNVDFSSYQPVWSVSNLKSPRPAAHDPNLFKVWSSAEIETMDGPALRSAYDALWQKYLGVKMLADFLLYRGVNDPTELPQATRDVYGDFFIPTSKRNY
jgi:hypothetical protein